MKNIYLVAAVIGFLAPYYFFLQVSGPGAFDLSRLLEQVAASQILSGLAMDLTVALIVFWIFLVVEAGRLHMKHPWLYVLATLFVGLSLALPLFLYARERKLEAA